MYAGIAQLVERQPSKLNVASSNLVSRSNVVSVVQLVEREFVVLVVAGSSPVVHPILISPVRPSVRTPDFHSGERSSILLRGTINGEIPEWPKGADCKSAGSAFEGSNPSLTTIKI